MTTIRKHLVNAFENVGKEYGWDDGLKTPYTARRQGFNYLREWARCMAANYMPENHILMPDSLLEMIEDAQRAGIPLTQHDFDAYAEEEVNAW